MLRPGRAGRKKGRDTFGAVLVHNGEILEAAENTADYERGIFGHAEFNLVHQCTNKYSDQVLRESILYTSCAPCERCLAAIASFGIQNVPLEELITEMDAVKAAARRS